MPTMEMPKNLKKLHTVREVGTAAPTDSSLPSKASSPDWPSGRAVFGVPMMHSDAQSGRRRTRCQCGDDLNVRRRYHCQSPGDLHAGHRGHRQTPDDLNGRRRYDRQSPGDLNDRHRGHCQSLDDLHVRRRGHCHTGNDLNGQRIHDPESTNRRNINHLRDWRRFSHESHAVWRWHQVRRSECPLGQSQLCARTGRSGLCPAAGSTNSTNQKERT